MQTTETTPIATDEVIIEVWRHKREIAEEHAPTDIIPSTAAALSRETGYTLGRISSQKVSI